ILVAHPASLAGTRLFREAGPDTEARLRDYDHQLEFILNRPLPIQEGTRNVLTPRVIALDSDARGLAIAFSDSVERKLGIDGEYAAIRGFASKALEHAIRIAAVIAYFENPDVEALTAEDLSRGIELCNFYLSEALRLFGEVAPSPSLILANKTIGWIRRCWDEELITIEDICRGGPSAVRAKDKAERVVEILVDHGHLTLAEESATGKSWSDKYRINSHE
ncbi:MAG: DUF3987 domain-containing protein, partial [Pseudomonadota bacterium]